MTQKLRLIFMGTPEFSVPILQALIDSPHEVVAVYTQPPRPANRGKKETPTPVHQLAEQHQLKVHTPLSLKSAEEQKLFADYHADAAIVAAYGLLLPKAVLDAPKMGCLNVHTSKLPRWRGAAPIQRAIMAGDSETAICIMQMDVGLDTGAILLEQPLPITPDMTAGQLHDEMSAKSGGLVLQALEGLANNKLSPRPQSEDGVTYAAKISKEEAKIDWNQPGQSIINHIRGLNPFPGAFLLCNGERYKILAARFEPGAAKAAPGVFADDRLAVACADGIVRIAELQKEGKQRMDAETFLRGYALPAGLKAE